MTATQRMMNVVASSTLNLYLMQTSPTSAASLAHEPAFKIKFSHCIAYLLPQMLSDAYLKWLCQWTNTVFVQHFS